MKKYQWMGLPDASNAHAFHQYDLRESDRMIWAVERECGSFTSSALHEGGELCPFCIRAVRREWLRDRLFDCVLIARSVRWTARSAVRWVEHRLWGRP